MEKLIREKGERSPEVKLDPKNGDCIIKGRSIPGDVEAFYKPILDWFDDYISAPANSTELTLDLKAFNIATSKKILFILYKLDELKKGGNDVKVYWIYDTQDDDMLEVGQDYANMVDVPFTILPRQKKEEKAGAASVI